jgi:hypothetical protein
MPTLQNLVDSDFSALEEAITTKAKSRAFTESFLLDVVQSHLALYVDERLGLTPRQLRALVAVLNAAKLAR